MTRDPLYRQILERLGEQLDPYLFEDCVSDLLRDAFPGLVPISGGRGGDRGMDGAIADGEGEAYPLVATTSAELRANLEDNLESHRRQGGRRDKVVFATSRDVNPAIRQKLEETARAKGFTLVQVFDRHSIADRLYRNPRWCTDLLALSGAPSALSALPLGRRPMLEIERVGREPDLHWLRSTEGDRLLVGEPGSGKTFLLYQLVREDRGLFLANEDRTAIANAVREYDPAAILVDDAHLDPERLVRLRHLRQEISAGFDLVAATWTGAGDRVADALGGLAGPQIHALEGLARNEIVEIYRRAGVDIPDEGMRELVDQAANNPGLAITLAQTFLRGEYDALIRGEALGRAVATLFDGLIGDEATAILAAFAIGGDSGIPMDAVGRTLGLRLVDVHRIASGLAAGGVLTEVGGNGLAVRPWQLRAALVARVFFSEPALDWRPLAELAPSRDEVARALILAAGRGAPVPESILREETARSTSRRVWQSLAHLSRSQAEWVLDHYAGDLHDVLDAALGQAPEAALPRLLAAAAGEPRSGRPSTDRLAPLRAWLREIPPHNATTESMRRREAAVRAAVEYLSAEGGAEIGVQALCAALSPRLEATRRDPGMGDRLTISLGAELPPPTIPEFGRLWDLSEEALPPISGLAWREFRTLLGEWTQPPLTQRTEPEVLRTRHAFAGRILRDLAARSRGNPGLTSEIQKAVERLDTLDPDLDLDLGLEPDPVFELLFDDDALATDEEKAQRTAEMEALASSWASLDPAEALADFRDLEASARAYRPHLNFWQVRKFGALLATMVDRPEAWLTAALDAEHGVALAEAFLRRMAELKRPGWENAIERCLSIDRAAWSAAEVMLQLEDPPENLLSLATRKATGFPQLIETLASGGRIPSKTMLRLLGHRDWRIAAAAAVGEWNAGSRGKVRPELQAAWRSAILRTRTSECVGELVEAGLDVWLIAILGSDSDLALDWLRARLDEPEHFPFNLLMDETSSHTTFATAVKGLSSGQKLELLNSLRPLPPDNNLFVKDLLTLLIGRDAALFMELLERDDLDAYRLAPLRGRPDRAWTELASLALRHGASTEAIVGEAFSVPRTIVGSGVEYWQAWKDAFEALLSDPRPGLREIGRLGSQQAQLLVEEAEKKWAETERRGF